MNPANLIRLSATAGSAPDLAAFLEGGAALVGATEPLTSRWYALAREDRPEQLAIFDVFASAEGRQAHFDGQVAAALAERAADLVEGGWPGVLRHVNHLTCIAQHHADAGRTVRLATCIELRAASGQADALAAFLRAGCDLVAETEPDTLYWTALRWEDEPDRFAIFDLFADASGRAAHFGGQVAAALKDRAGVLVEGGWDAVLAAVVHYEVRGAVRRLRAHSVRAPGLSPRRRLWTRWG